MTDKLKPCPFCNGEVILEKNELDCWVVRCKDCRHWGGVPFGYVCRRFSGTYIRNETKENDFCSYGELKEREGK